MPAPSSEVAVTVNGEALRLPAAATLADVLERLGVRSEAVAVERNGAIVRRAAHATTAVEAGDVIEVVTFVGGG